LPDWFWYGTVFCYGAMVGSFCNVLIYRLPLGISVVAPPSHCPRCRTYLGIWDNIPLLSFLFLRARCRYCRAPISWRYFLVELLSASLWVCVFHRLSGDTGISWVGVVAQALFASLLIAVIFIDLDHFLIPDELNWAGAALAAGRDLLCLALARQAGNGYWSDALREFTYGGWLPRFLVGAVVYGGLLFAISFFTFLYYARGENEPLAQTARRFWVEEEEEEGPAATEEAETEEEEAEPVRLRFSPAFLALVSALLLAPVLRAWAAALVLALALAFVALSRRPGEPPAATLGRFFRADEGDAAGGNPDAEINAAEADQFAREAETGRHGGMGLGDAKLAVAIERDIAHTTPVGSPAEEAGAAQRRAPVFPFGPVEAV